jgi:hypothetical protein
MTGRLTQLIYTKLISKYIGNLTDLLFLSENVILYKNRNFLFNMSNRSYFLLYKWSKPRILLKTEWRSWAIPFTSVLDTKGSALMIVNGNESEPRYSELCFLFYNILHPLITPLLGISILRTQFPNAPVYVLPYNNLPRNGRLNYTVINKDY